jgi:hypothetical protein
MRNVPLFIDEMMKTFFRMVWRGTPFTAGVTFAMVAFVHPAISSVLPWLPSILLLLSGIGFGIGIGAQRAGLVNFPLIGDEGESAAERCTRYKQIYIVGNALPGAILGSVMASAVYTLFLFSDSRSAVFLAVLCLIQAAFGITLLYIAVATAEGTPTRDHHHQSYIALRESLMNAGGIILIIALSVVFTTHPPGAMEQNASDQIERVMQ